MGSLPFLQWIFLTQESNWGLLHCRWILYQLSYQGTGVPKSLYWKCVSELTIPWRALGVQNLNIKEGLPQSQPAWQVC